jgi:D-3-phosphoglycerate dehydrogenase / 2-oxoglutarate reductase
MKVLANDGIDAKGKLALENLGFAVITEKVNQVNLIDYINSEGVIGILVRSATTVRKDVIDACPNLKFIGRGGVGIDNIDAAYAKEKGVVVFNTPASSSQSVAELVMAFVFASNRFIFQAGAHMPSSGASEFNNLKKSYGKGIEAHGKVLGIIGFGRIGQALAKYAIGCGMEVLFYDRGKEDAKLDLTIAGNNIEVELKVTPLNELLQKSDFVSIHVPKQTNGNSVIGANELKQLKKTAVVINTSRGGSINEEDLLHALNNGLLRGACLDVFENEPQPKVELLKHPLIISTPHIGAATAEAQERIGQEIAANVKAIMNL